MASQHRNFRFCPDVCKRSRHTPVRNRCCIYQCDAPQLLCPEMFKNELRCRRAMQIRNDVMTRFFFTNVLTFLLPEEMVPLMHASWVSSTEIAAHTMQLGLRVNACPTCETVTWFESRTREPSACPRCAGPRIWTRAGVIYIPQELEQERTGVVWGITMVRAILGTMAMDEITDGDRP